MVNKEKTGAQYKEEFIMDNEFVFGGYFMGITVEGKEYDDGHVVVLKGADESFLGKLKERGYDVDASCKGKFVVLTNYENDYEPMLKKAWVKEKYSYDNMLEDFYGDE